MQQFLVLDIGGTKIRYGLCQGAQLDSIGEFATPKVTAREFVNEIENHVSHLILKNNISGVGVASAGPIDYVKGEIRNPANLGNGDESWKCFELEKDLSHVLNLPVKVDNDAALTALGFYSHYEKGANKDLLVITLGTGLGVGAIVNGEPARAGQNMHPELGHFIVADEATEFDTLFDGFPTLESYLSGTHFASRVGVSLKKNLNGAQLLELSELGNEIVFKHWEEYSKRMAIAWTNLYLAYFPNKIVLAGGFAGAAKEFYFEKAQFWFSKLMSHRTDAGMALPEIVISANSEDLPLLGAGRLIENHLKK